jgi:hypothetical protein
VGVPEVKRPLESLSLGVSIILKLFLKAYDVGLSTELINLAGLKKKFFFYERRKGLSASVKCREFFE